MNASKIVITTGADDLQKEEFPKTICVNSQTLKVYWTYKAYIVPEKSVAHSPICWGCGMPFEGGDGIIMVSTSQGNIVMHSRCLDC